jgi:hypothetical protein
VITEDGILRAYLGEGSFTDDPIPKDFFGCAGVGEIPDLQGALQTIGYMGHRHHTAVTVSHVLDPVLEALEMYLGFEVTVV